MRGCEGDERIGPDPDPKADPGSSPRPIACAEVGEAGLSRARSCGPRGLGVREPPPPPKGPPGGGSPKPRPAPDPLGDGRRRLVAAARSAAVLPSAAASSRLRMTTCTAQRGSAFQRSPINAPTQVHSCAEVLACRDVRWFTSLGCEAYKCIHSMSAILRN